MDPYWVMALLIVHKSIDFVIHDISIFMSKCTFTAGFTHSSLSLIPTTESVNYIVLFNDYCVISTENILSHEVDVPITFLNEWVNTMTPLLFLQMIKH